MPIVESPAWGPKPSYELLGGSPSSLAASSYPLASGGRTVTMIGGSLRTVSYVDIYRSQPWVGSTIKKLAGHVARLSLQVIQNLDAAGEQRQRDRNHPAAQLLGRPRPRRRGFHLRWDLALSLWTHGNYVAWKRRPRRGAPPAELWTLDWRLLTPIMLGDRVLAWRWAGRGVPGLQPGDTILVEDTIHVGFGTPGGGDLGVSPLEQLGVTIRSEDALQRYSESSMRHGTRFGMAAILDKSVKADRAVRDGVREELMDVHGGVDHAFKPAILGGGVTDLKPLAEQSAVEAELIAQRKVNREEIAAVVDIPAPLAGILDEANYNAMSAFHRILYVTTLGGPLALVAESLQAQLVDDEPAWNSDGRFLEFSLDEVLKGDPKERWETYAVALDHGGLTLNDVRRKENLPPYADPRADEPLIAANNVRPLSAVGDASFVPGHGAAPAALVEVLAHHAARAFDRAARGAGAGRNVLEALDRDRVQRELAGDLEAAGLNGSSSSIAELTAGELERLLAEATTGDDVRAVAAAYPLTQEDPIA